MGDGISCVRLRHLVHDAFKIAHKDDALAFDIWLMVHGTRFDPDCLFHDLTLFLKSGLINDRRCGLKCCCRVCGAIPVQVPAGEQVPW